MAPGFEEIELVTIVDVLRRAGLDVVVAGLGPDPVVGAHGMSMHADRPIEQIDAAGFDGIVLAGGMGGTLAMVESEEVLAAVRSLRASRRLVAAICAAPLVLSAADVIGQAAITCHPSVRERLAAHEVRAEARVLRSDGLITSCGPGSAMEFALALVAELCGAERAAQLAGAMVVA